MPFTRREKRQKFARFLRMAIGNALPENLLTKLVDVIPKDARDCEYTVDVRVEGGDPDAFYQLDCYDRRCVHQVFCIGFYPVDPIPFVDVLGADSPFSPWFARVDDTSASFVKTDHAPNEFRLDASRLLPEEHTTLICSRKVK